jgi:NADPH:quinone reductase-like Zn-dependent oxidoreductase
MRAIVQPRYGPPESVELREVPAPEPEAGEVLVRVHASSVNAADCETLHGYIFVRMASPFRPGNRIVGSDVAGTVERVGPGVTGLAEGDQVMGDTSEHGYGAFAEYVAVPADALCRLPDGLEMEAAAAVPSAAWVAIKVMRDERLSKPGCRMLVNGAGGSMGTFAVQMASARGAHVTAVDSAAKLELLRAIGADEVIDYRAQDPLATGATYDLVLDVFARRSVHEWQRVLTPGGAYRMVGGSAWRVLHGFAVGRRLSQGSDQDIGMLYGWPHTRADMEEVNALLEPGAVRPVIDRVYPLEEAAAALRRVEDGLALGKVVVRVAEA